MAFATMTSAYIKLDDVLLSPPLPATIAFLMGIGILHFARRTAKLLRKNEADALDMVASFGLVAGGLGGVVNLAVLAGFVHIDWLRPVAWGIAVFGFIDIPFLWRCVWGYLKGTWMSADGITRVIVALALFIFVGLLASALGPVTDADSLDYHLGVPLDWLRHGGSYPRTDLLHVRLVGLGEVLNLIGLAGGTDSFGAVLQAIAVGLIFVAASQWATNSAEKGFIALLVLGCPLLAFLVPNQKPQLIATLATTVALILAIRRRYRFDMPTLVLIWANIWFAISCKHSFLLSGGVVAILTLVLTFRKGRMALSLAFAASGFCLMALPIYCRNAAYYGDPVWPLLSRFLPDADPSATGFAQYLRACGGEVSLHRLLRMPIELAVTFDPARLSTVLGMGTFALILGNFRNRDFLMFAVCGIGTGALLLWLGSWSPRWFFEPYLWIAAGVVGAEWNWRKYVFSRVLMGQGLLVLVMAIFEACLLFPGALSPSLRCRVMTQVAQDYEESIWLDAVLPNDARVITTTRSRALLPRAFVATEVADYIESRKAKRIRLQEIFKEERPTVAVLPYPLDAQALQDFGPYLAAAPFAKAEFSYATRNPYNRGRRYQMAAFEIVQPGIGSYHSGIGDDTPPSDKYR